MAYVAGPYLAPHLLVKMGGFLPGGEEWSAQFRMGQIGAGPWPPPASMTDPVCDGIFTAILAFWQRPATKMHFQARLASVKINTVGVNGRYVLQTTNAYASTGIAGGVNAAPLYPNQVALAVTLRTGFRNGFGHSGRFFLPIPVAVVQTDGLISIADRDVVKGSVNTFMAALNAVSPKYQLSVFSRKLGSPTQRPVTSIDIGRALDTQRSRRRNLKESY